MHDVTETVIASSLLMATLFSLRVCTLYTLLKMGSYSSTMVCQYWDNRLIY